MKVRLKNTAAANRRGFTLIELLLVMVILGILAAIVLPNYMGRTEDTKVKAAVTQLSAFKTALDMFEVDNGHYPSGKAGLDDLIVAPRNAPDWKGPYVQGGLPLDPWRRPYIYEYPGKHNPAFYDLMSMGPDGQAGGGDDICNWPQPTQAAK